MCCPSVCFNISNQTGSAQLACPLAWITSAPGSPPILDPIYPYMVQSMAPSSGSQAALAFNPTRSIHIGTCIHPQSCHPRPSIMQEASNHEDELCGHSHATQHKTSKHCTCFHNSNHSQASYSPHSSQVHQVH